MQLEALVLIEDDKVAQRLVVTWPQIGRDWAQAQDHEDPDEREEALERARERWASLSGVYIEDIRKYEPILFDNGIVGPEGIVEAQVLALIRARIAKSLPRREPRKAQAGDGP